MAKKESILGNFAEQKFINFLNGKKFNDIDDSRIKTLIKRAIYQNNLKNTNPTIKCFKYKKKNLKTKGNPKVDIIISFEGKILNISLKSGSGNSLHEEPQETFLLFLKELKAKDEILEKISHHLHYHVKIRNTEIDYFFNLNKIKIINRVINGRFNIYNENSVDFYYAIQSLKNTMDNQKISEIIKNGYFASKKDVLNFMINNNPDKKGRESTCDVGLLTYQSYNRNKGAKPQFKWAQPYLDLKKIWNLNEKQ